MIFLVNNRDGSHVSIAHVTASKKLGEIVQNTLRPQMYVEAVVSKARSKLAFIRRTLL